MNAGKRPRSTAREQRGGHAGPELIRRYVRGDEPVPGEEIWALEAHLESCGHCRGRIADLSTDHAPHVDSLIENVWAGLEPAMASTTPVRKRGRPGMWLRTWATPAVIPWLVMVLLVTAVAIVADLGMGSAEIIRPSVLSAIAPLVPVLAVAAAWSRAFDPAYELTVATARAGLQLVLRRTLAVLVVVIPCLVVAGWIVGASPFTWLLPSLAFTVATLALGSVFGIARAALCLVLAWTAGGFVPSLLAERPPIVFDPAIAPLWGGAAVLCGVVLLARSTAFTTIRNQ